MKKPKCEVVRLSNEAAEVRPLLVAFIRSLKYSKKKAELFADGYLARVRRLPTLRKLEALSRQDDECMTAGFQAAEIDEDQALKRAGKR